MIIHSCRQSAEWQATNNTVFTSISCWFLRLHVAVDEVLSSNCRILRQIMTTITSALSDILTPTQFAPMLTAMSICKTVVLFVTALTITKRQYFAINYIRRGIAASSQTNMTN